MPGPPVAPYSHSVTPASSSMERFDSEANGLVVSDVLLQATGGPIRIAWRNNPDNTIEIVENATAGYESFPVGELLVSQGASAGGTLTLLGVVDWRRQP